MCFWVQVPLLNVALLRLECLSMLETLYDRNCAADEEKSAEKKRRREKGEE